MSLQNVWHHRKVADNAAKACDICYKPSTSVLITPDNKVKSFHFSRLYIALGRPFSLTVVLQDFFYVCPIHLKDSRFCSPIVDTEAEAAKKRKEALDREIERVKKEYEEKMKRKKAKEEEEKKQSEKGDEKDGKNEGDKTKNEDEKKAEKEKNDKVYMDWNCIGN